MSAIIGKSECPGVPDAEPEKQHTCTNVQGKIKAHEFNAADWMVRKRIGAQDHLDGPWTSEKTDRPTDGWSGIP